MDLADPPPNGQAHTASVPSCPLVCLASFSECRKIRRASSCVFNELPSSCWQLWSWGSVFLSSANSQSDPILFLSSNQMAWGKGASSLNGKDLKRKRGTQNIFDKGPWLEQRSHLILRGATCPLLDGVWAQFSESLFPHSSSGAVALPVPGAKGMLSWTWHDFSHA